MPDPTIIPCLFYRDAPAAIAWLQRAFGFHALSVTPGPDDTILHAELAIGPAVIMLNSARPEMGWVSPRDLTGLNQSVYIALDDVDAHHARAVAAGAEITHALADKPYGGRGYSALDPEGHFWSFGGYRPDLTATA
ncbi:MULTISPECIES: VOC family protein [Inquilinus]|uniref:Glyoxalase superfamily protein PhnB n=1 Tax=Inquilinus ginsengisoli TaxID=363840 RepID=A0ABU1JNI6_9PROT|nr:VOC family protein [Inquilinus ginsengisoli]MDR6290182.1 putative glyoxalase superfamily protein PhnB [Inquilinus ginsengisoli]